MSKSHQTTGTKKGTSDSSKDEKLEIRLAPIESSSESDTSESEKPKPAEKPQEEKEKPGEAEEKKKEKEGEREKTKNKGIPKFLCICVSSLLSSLHHLSEAHGHSLLIKPAPPSWIDDNIRLLELLLEILETYPAASYSILAFKVQPFPFHCGYASSLPSSTFSVLSASSTSSSPSPSPSSSPSLSAFSLPSTTQKHLTDGIAQFLFSRFEVLPPECRSSLSSLLVNLFGTSSTAKTEILRSLTATIERQVQLVETIMKEPIPSRALSSGEASKEGKEEESKEDDKKSEVEEKEDAEDEKYRRFFRTLLHS